MAEIRAALAVGKEVITHTAAVSVPGWTGAGYVILDPETNVGAWKISGGENGGSLFPAVGYVLEALNYFYGALNAISATVGKAIPALNKIVQLIDIARFTYSLLDKGLNCNGFDAIAYILTVTAIFSLLLTELSLVLFNPIAAFAISVGSSLASTWLINQTPDCRRDE
jgi:hypothetical protein